MVIIIQPIGTNLINQGSICGSLTGCDVMKKTGLLLVLPVWAAFIEPQGKPN
jgi:hypothetical protein